MSATQIAAAHHAAARYDLDAYETGEWPDVEPTECPDCNGGGITYPATWIDPEEICEACDGTGVRDCNCPGRCAHHEERAEMTGNPPAHWAATYLDTPPF